MRGLSLFFFAGGLLSMFGSAVSFGLAFIEQLKGSSWAPTRTGAFIMHYFGFDVGSLQVFQVAGAQQIVSFILDEQLYKTGFVLGLLMLFAGLATRGGEEH